MKYNMLDHFGWSENWESIDEMEYRNILILNLCIDGQNRRQNLMSKGPQFVSKEGQEILFESGH